jgi:hypothetical protein
LKAGVFVGACCVWPRIRQQPGAKANYMFKPTPELSLRLLWLSRRRGLTWR